LNSFQNKLYQSLMSLCTNVEAFYSKDHRLDGVLYRIFSYRIGTYTDFCQPQALECRGVMFRIAPDDTPIALVSLPLPKFFNIYENPMTMQPDFKQVIRFEEKADGSFVCTYLHNDRIRLKTKNSLDAAMTQDAMAFIDRADNKPLKNALEFFARNHATVLMEWCDPKPSSRIVIAYKHAHLRVFGLRDNTTGAIIDFHDQNEMLLRFTENTAMQHSAQLVQHSVQYHSPDDAQHFAENTASAKGIEGYVMVFQDGQRMKLKTNWYMTQHHLRDSVTHVNGLFKSVVQGSSDDLKSLFFDNQQALDLILQMEHYALPIYNNFINDVNAFYQNNKNLDKSEYVKKAKADLPEWMFGTLIKLYLKSEVDYAKVLTEKTRHVNMHTANFQKAP